MTTIQIDREIREARLSWFHYRFALVLGAVLFVDGYDLFNAAYIAPYIREEWGLSAQQIGFMLSMGIAGLACGAFVQAWVVRLIGLRLAVVAGTLLLSIASIGMGLVVSNFSSFVAMRFVLGVSLGMLSPLAFVYLNEWAPQASANRFATLGFVLPFSLGGVAAGLAAITLGPVVGWRGLYLLAGVGFPIAIAAYWFLPESMTKLVSEKRIDEIRAILSKARPDRRDAYRDTTRFELPVSERSNLGAKALFARPYRNRTIGIWVASALSLLCLHGISGWLPSILVANGQAFASAFGYGSLLMTMQILGGAITGVLADRFSRTSVMVWGFAGNAVAMLWLHASLGSWAIALAVAAAGFCIFGTQAVMNNFTAQSYEPALRSVGTGSAVAFSRIGGFFGPVLIGFTSSIDPTLQTTFILLAAAQVVAALIVFAIHKSASGEQAHWEKA